MDALIIDKDAAAFSDARKVLGPGTEWASSGTEGISRILRQRFNLVVIDAGMTDQSSLALATLAANEDCGVLLASDDEAERRRLQSLRLPVLPKPFDRHELGCRAAEVLVGVGENIARVRESAARMRASAAELDRIVGDSRRLVLASREMRRLRILPPVHGRVLLVHHQPEPLVALGDALSEAGHEVSGFSDVMSAWTMINSGLPVDVLLTTVNVVPRAPHGLALARMVQAKFPSVRVAVMASPGLVAQGRWIGQAIDPEAEVIDVVDAVAGLMAQRWPLPPVVGADSEVS